MARTPAMSKLSERELDLLGYIALGWSTKRVAGKLGTTERAVKSELLAIFTKCGAKFQGAGHRSRRAAEMHAERVIRELAAKQDGETALFRRAIVEAIRRVGTLSSRRRFRHP